MSKIVSIQSFRDTKNLDSYQARVNQMSRAELLEEMVRFREERETLRLLPVPVMKRAICLFRAMEGVADTLALKVFCRNSIIALQVEVDKVENKS